MDWTRLPRDVMGLEAIILQFLYCSRKYVPSLQKVFFTFKMDFKRRKFHTLPLFTKNIALKVETISKMRHRGALSPNSKWESIICRTGT